jgi:hypothetical protein
MYFTVSQISIAKVNIYAKLLVVIDLNISDVTYNIIVSRRLTNSQVLLQDL